MKSIHRTSATCHSCSVSPKVFASLNRLVVGCKLNVPKLEILLGVAGNRFEIYKSFKTDKQLCFRGFVVTSMLFSVSKTPGVCIEDFGVLFLRNSESSILPASHLFSPKKFFLDTAPIKHLLQPLNSGNRNDCSLQSCFESYTYVLEL